MNRIWGRIHASGGASLEAGRTFLAGCRNPNSPCLSMVFFEATSQTFTSRACHLPISKLATSHVLMHPKITRHCCRPVHNSPKGSSPTFRERISELRRNGTPEIVIGSTILALVGIDYALQVRNDQQREDMYRQLEREVRRDEATTRIEDKKMLDEGVATKIKFKCTIRKVPQNFDGHKCLKNVKVGDIVGLIEEGVGPDGQYNLCSIERGTVKDAADDSPEKEQRFSIGWYPCSCLQKIE